MTNLALIRLFSGVNSQVSFELESVRAGICAVWTLIGTLPGVAPHMTFQFAQLYTGIVTVWALVRLLMSVDITNMSHQFT